jgi:indolepyruvate ferredoxin oxidoreductase
LIEKLLPELSTINYDSILEIARLPEEIRGYDRVKESSIKIVEQKQNNLMAKLFS